LKQNKRYNKTNESQTSSQKKNTEIPNNDYFASQFMANTFDEKEERMLQNSILNKKRNSMGSKSIYTRKDIHI
jgi:hypothetical protein